MGFDNLVNHYRSWKLQDDDFLTTENTWRVMVLQAAFKLQEFISQHIPLPKEEIEQAMLAVEKHAKNATKITIKY